MMPPARFSRPPRTRPVVTGRNGLRLVLRAASWVALVIGLAMGLYLTLRPTSTFTDIWWLPRSVIAWADRHGQTRNFPAFALLAAPCLLVCNGRRARRWAIAGLASFVSITELAQYFIPGRWCEWQDVATGWAGLAFTWLVFELTFWAAWRVRQALKVLRAGPPPPDAVSPLATPRDGLKP